MEYMNLDRKKTILYKERNPPKHSKSSTKCRDFGGTPGYCPNMWTQLCHSSMHLPQLCPWWKKRERNMSEFLSIWTRKTITLKQSLPPCLPLCFLYSWQAKIIQKAYLFFVSPQIRNLEGKPGGKKLAIRSASIRLQWRTGDFDEYLHK